MQRMKLVKINIKPIVAIDAPSLLKSKINPVRKPDLIGFRKILEAKDPLRSISAFFKFEDIAVSKMRNQLTYDDALALMKIMADRHAPKVDDAYQIFTILKQLSIPTTIDIYNSYIKILVKNNDFGRKCIYLNSRG